MFLFLIMATGVLLPNPYTDELICFLICWKFIKYKHAITHDAGQNIVIGLVRQYTQYKIIWSRACAVQVDRKIIFNNFSYSILNGTYNKVSKIIYFDVGKGRYFADILPLEIYNFGFWAGGTGVGLIKSVLIQK